MANEKLKPLKFGEIIPLSAWALKLWFRNDPKGMVADVIIEVVDTVLPVVKGVIVGYVISSLTVMAGKQLSFIAVLQALIPYGIFYIINQITDHLSLFISTRSARMQDMWLDKIYADKNQELEPGDVLRHEVTTMKMFADDGKTAFAMTATVSVSLLSYVISLGAALGVLIHFGLWLAIPVALLSAIPLLFVSGKRTREIWKLNNDNIEKRKRSREAVAALFAVGNTHKELHQTGSRRIFENIGFGFINWYNLRLIEITKKWFQSRVLLTVIEAIALTSTLAYYGVSFVTLGQIGLFVTIFEIFGQVRAAFVNITNNISRISENSPYLFMFRKYMEYTSAKLFTEEYSFNLQVSPQIDAEHVSFTYPDTEKEILHDISFHVKPGEKIAFVGENGVGKTTLMHLISGLYKPTSGKILVDGKDLFSLKQTDWYGATGFLLQTYGTYPFLTVKEFLQTGKADKKVTDEELAHALSRADAFDFVSEYKEKFNQILSSQYKGGIAPSTGQSQKLAIAKLFYRNPLIVIFDEPTASIDAESEFRIFNEIYEFFKGKTVIIVSHRFSTVRNADRIYVLSGGRIAEQGTHVELVEQNGIYASAYEKQASGYR